jgi:hypothetical protein
VRDTAPTPFDFYFHFVGHGDVQHTCNDDAIAMAKRASILPCIIDSTATHHICGSHFFCPFLAAAVAFPVLVGALAGDRAGATMLGPEAAAAALAIAAAVGDVYDEDMRALMRGSLLLALGLEV